MKPLKREKTEGGGISLVWILLEKVSWKWADSFEGSKKTFSSSFPQRSKKCAPLFLRQLKLIPAFHVKLGHFATGWEKQSTPQLFGKKNNNIYIKFNTSVKARGGGGGEGKQDRPQGRRSCVATVEDQLLALTFLFSLVCLLVCFLLFTVLHLDCTPLHFSLTDAFFFLLLLFFFKNSKNRREEEKNKVPFLRDDVLYPFFFFADQIPMPPSRLPSFFFFFLFLRNRLK